MKSWLLIGAIFGMAGCVATTLPSDKAAVIKTEVIKASQPLLSGKPLSLQQIMADPSWIGSAPMRASWHDDSQSVFYQIKREGSVLFDGYHHALTGQPVKLPLSQQHLLAQRDGVVSQDGKHLAFIFRSNLFVKQLSDGAIRQLTKDNLQQSAPQFLVDGRLAYVQGNAFYALDLNSGFSELLVDVKFAKKPLAPEAPTSYIGQQQHRLINYVALQQHNKAVKFEHQQSLNAQNNTIANPAFYIDPKQELVEFSLSPSGEHLIVVTRDSTYSWRGKHDIMPNYLGSDGYIDSVNARSRVAEDQPPAHQFTMIDIEQGTHKLIALNTLPGYDEDVLADIKRENHANVGKKYVSKKSARKIVLMQDWGWDQSAITWNNSGSEVALMLEARDNKDRWLARYNFDHGNLETLHRLHDDAWVNYTFNEFGWLNDDSSLYYLSEQSGYSHLYVKSPSKAAKAFTAGSFEVSSLTLSANGKFIYYKANKAHPGQYEIYRVAVATGEDQQLTHLKGMTDYQLSPDQSKLLLTHSSLLRHHDIYVKNSDGSGKISRITNTVSEEFSAYDWQAPQIVAVPSSHGEQPVYAKVYLPNGYDSTKAQQYPAVIFNHGAGYLQNSHYGWSGYFREFMFHNLLAQQGYVVMDMDYRASKGYGRDWRTAIYRQMGTPEIEDLADGVSYMAKNLNVDRDRVGTYGGSYGGFMTFMALFTQPELFQAGAALRPVTDWAHYNHGYTSNILNTPNDDDIAFRRSSPIEHAHNLTKPLLIMSGVLDDNVFFQDSVRLVQRLIELEKPMFEMAIYPVEPHGFRQPSSWLDQYRRILNLFEHNLKTTE